MFRVFEENERKKCCLLDSPNLGQCRAQHWRDYGEIHLENVAGSETQESVVENCEYPVA
jgi:hypothetical protein